MADDRKDCCKDEANLKAEATDRPDLTMKRCAVCHCRHFELAAEPGVLGVTGKSI